MEAPWCEQVPSRLATPRDASRCLPKSSKAVIEQFDANMKKAGKDLTYKIFPGVHGFANPSNPKYDEENAKIAYGMALGYLKKRLKV